MNNAYLVAGLAYGDEGKGATVDYLVRKHQASIVVRYNGGAQAAHNVITPEGKHHTFAQFGSGTLAGAKTHLSNHVLIEPRFLVNEAKHLEELGVTNIWDKITIDEKALVITPFQIAANRIIEAYRSKITKREHGTCGMGIGQTRSDHLQYGDEVLFAGDLKDKDITIKKLKFLQDKSYTACETYIRQDLLMPNSSYCLRIGEQQKLLHPEFAEYYWETHYKNFPRIVPDKRYITVALRNQNIVFEGAQGMLIDEKYGQAPHNTWTDITFNNANEILAKADFRGKVDRVGVVRTYFTRHGAGPFTQYNPSYNYPEPHNCGGWAGEFRQGDFDFVEANYALRAIGGVDTLAINHVDCFDNVDQIANFLHVDRLILGFGPTAEDRKERIRSTEDDDIRRSVCCR